jgi:uncharacterized protein
MTSSHANPVTASLIEKILEDYTLPRFGRHGLTHWARVYTNGVQLAQLTGANLNTVRLFAVFHDSRRGTEGIDPDHGLRAAKFAKSLQGILFELQEEELQLLYQACADHTKGVTEAEITVQTCWDADRLDLARAGIWPTPNLLCTAAAKNPQLIAWANQRSLEDFRPSFLHSKWLSSP